MSAIPSEISRFEHRDQLHHNETFCKCYTILLIIMNTFYHSTIIIFSEASPVSKNMVSPKLNLYMYQALNCHHEYRWMQGSNLVKWWHILKVSYSAKVMSLWLVNIMLNRTCWSLRENLPNMFEFTVYSLLVWSPNSSLCVGE